MTQGTFLRPIRNKFIEDFITDVANTATSYYVTFGKFDEWPTVYDPANSAIIISDELNPPATNTSISISTYEVYRNMLYGKQIFGPNVAYVVKKVDWTANTVYDYYDDQDPNLYTKNFYVINSSNRVYKCLFNNYGSPSTVEPTDFNPNGDFVTLPDGYKWKYLYSISAADAAKFSSSNYVPASTDPGVEAAAANGAIHVVIVNNAGTNYPYANGQVVSRVSPTVIKVSPVGIDSIGGLYQDSSMYVYAGSGNNFITPILDYTVNSSGNFITTSKVTPILDSTSFYKIGPTVTVTGDGTGMEAFAYVEPVANSVASVDVVNQGYNYTYATIGFAANNIALGSGGGATARAIISPQRGHGADVTSELGCDTAVISAEVQDPQDDLPTWATYRQIALLYNPTSSSNNATYLDNYFKQYTTLQLAFFSGIFPTGSTLTGLQSGATGTIVHSDVGNVYVTGVVGSFKANETIFEPTYGLTNIISAINNNELVPYSGEIFYYKNIEAITRYTGSREQVKIYFKI